MRMFYRDVLEGAGFEVEEAVNGMEGVERAMTGSFDLLVVDVNMPKMDGYQVIRTVREDPALWRVPVITISTEDKEQDALKAYEAGANFYLTKPVRPKDLEEMARLLTGTSMPMTTLLERFIPEAREHLESAAAGLLKLERDPSDEGLVNEVFRAVHTLKGASGLFDMPGLTRLVHAGEDLLGAVRSHHLTLDPDMVDALLDALDRVSAWVDELERHGQLPGDAEGASVELSKRLRAWLPSADETKSAARRAATRGRARIGWVNSPEADRLAAFTETVAGGPPLLAVSYTPDDGCFYRGEDPFNLFPQLTGLRALRVFFREPPVPLSETDPFHSALAFRALVGQPRAEVEHLFRYVIEQVTIVAVPPEALILPAGSSVASLAIRISSRMPDVGWRRRDFAGLRTAVATLLGLSSSGQLWIASALRWLDAVLAAPLPHATWASAVVDCIADGHSRPIGGTGPSEVAAPTSENASIANSDKPMAARILAEQMRIVTMPGGPEVTPAPHDRGGGDARQSAGEPGLVGTRRRTGCSHRGSGGRGTGAATDTDNRAGESGRCRSGWPRTGSRGRDGASGAGHRAARGRRG